MKVLKAAAFDLGNTLVREQVSYQNSSAGEWKSVAVPGITDALHTLQERGVILVVGSNADSPVAHTAAMLEQAGIRAYFMQVFNSHQLQVSKPDVRFFYKMLAVMQIQPHECVMIGDSLYNDVQGAKNAGMSAIWYAPHHHNPHSEEADSVITHMNGLIAAIDALDLRLSERHL